VLGLHRLVKGGIEDHVDFSFRLFDVDNDGSIGRNEVIKMLRAAFSLKEHDNETIDMLTEACIAAFRTADVKRITRAEFMDALERNPELRKVPPHRPLCRRPLIPSVPGLLGHPRCHSERTQGHRDQTLDRLVVRLYRCTLSHITRHHGEL
jgi:hypothetical protein